MFLCNNSFNPKVIKSSSQFVAFSVMVDNQEIFISAVNAKSNYIQRRSVFKEGGLGIRPMRAANEAASLKLCWEFLTSNGQWAAFLRARLLRQDLPRSSY